MESKVKEEVKVEEKNAVEEPVLEAEEAMEEDEMERFEYEPTLRQKAKKVLKKTRAFAAGVAVGAIGTLTVQFIKARREDAVDEYDYDEVDVADGTDEQ